LDDRATVSSAIDNIPSHRIYPTGMPIGWMTDMDSALLLAEAPFWFVFPVSCPENCAPSSLYSHAYTGRLLTVCRN
jgi:hypothetical protein